MALNSIVAYDLSGSESDSSNNDADYDGEERHGQFASEKTVDDDKVVGQKIERNASADDSDSSDDGESSASGFRSGLAVFRGSGGTKPALPKPRFLAGLSTIGNLVPSDRSIFHNPFREEEVSRNCALQQHVQLTDLKTANRRDRPIVCKAFKKGFCPKGAKCRFVHVQPATPQAPEPANERCQGAFGHVTGAHNNVAVMSQYEAAVITAPPHLNLSAAAPKGFAHNSESFFDDGETANTQRRKRVGVSDTLLPPKKAMKAYEALKSQQQEYSGSGKSIKLL